LGNDHGSSWKDPYFYPWIDTPSSTTPTWIEAAHDRHVCHWAKTVDGVRCDMAMLVLREQVKIHRHPEMTWQEFNQLMPNEFWTEAIRREAGKSEFCVHGETYWSMEGYLQSLDLITPTTNPSMKRSAARCTAPSEA